MKTKTAAQASLGEACDVVVRNGQKPAHAGIIGHTLEHDSHAIVIGTGDTRGLSRLFLGSVAMEVANRAPCTVIVSRRSRRSVSTGGFVMPSRPGAGPRPETSTQRRKGQDHEPT